MQRNCIQENLHQKIYPKVGVSVQTALNTSCALPSQRSLDIGINFVFVLPPKVSCYSRANQTYILYYFNFSDHMYQNRFEGNHPSFLLFLCFTPYQRDNYCCEISPGGKKVMLVEKNAKLLAINFPECNLKSKVLLTAKICNKTLNKR